MNWCSCSFIFTFLSVYKFTKDFLFLFWGAKMILITSLKLATAYMYSVCIKLNYGMYCTEKHSHKYTGWPKKKFNSWHKLFSDIIYSMLLFLGVENYYFEKNYTRIINFWVRHFDSRAIFIVVFMFKARADVRLSTQLILWNAVWQKVLAASSMALGARVSNFKNIASLK